jgi:hypothetical protein
MIALHYPLMHVQHDMFAAPVVFILLLGMNCA